MSRAPTRPPELVGRVFRGTAVVRHGLLTPDQLRSSAWRRVFPDVHCDAQLPTTHLLRTRAATLAVPRAVVTGRSAAVIWGVPLAAGSDAVELTVPPGTSAVLLPQVRARRSQLAAEDVTRHRDLPLTSPLATAIEVARRHTDVDAAVVDLDRLLQRGLFDLVELRARAATTTGRGCLMARAAAALADGLAESPPETRLRLLLHRSSLPRPVAQYRVRDGDRFLARVDFGWPELRLAVEYDGLWHRDAAQFTADRARLNRLTAAGWTVVFVTADDLRRPATLLARLTAAVTAHP